MTWFSLLVTLLFGASALAALVRIVRGPSLLDRVIASDVLLTTLALAVGADMVLSGHTTTIPVMLALAGTAIFGTVAVSRYVSAQGDTHLADAAVLGDEPAPDASTSPEATSGPDVVPEPRAEHP